MLDVDIELANAEETDKQRMYKTARRRSLSGSAVPSKVANRRVNFGLKQNKMKLRQSDNRKEFESTDTILSESIESLSSSSGINVSDLNRKSNSSDNSSTYCSGHRRKSHSVSAKMKIKHYLTEHIVKIHPCHHPEYHFSKKDCDKNNSVYSSKTNDLNESDFQEFSSMGSSETSSSKEISSPMGKSTHDIASTIVDRIRNININSQNPSAAPDFNSLSGGDVIATMEDVKNGAYISESCLEFPFPEPNPYKLPKVVAPCSLVFSSTQMLTNKSQRHRLAHSISYDPAYKYVDAPKNIKGKRWNQSTALCPDFIPEKDKWERKISGYLDTSTPTGATLTAINFGLKRVTETGKYLMITKSPTSCPSEFLEEGINYVEATSAIYQSLMRHSTCYDAMPGSGKVVIIDSQMQIGRAFNAIEDNIVRASPIWSSEKQSFIALLSVNDMVPLLLHMHQKLNGAYNCCEDEDPPEDISTTTVEKCLHIIPKFRCLQNHIVGVTPETSLHAASLVFAQLQKSTLLVIDSFLSGNALFLLTALQTLTYIFSKAYTLSLESCFLTKIHASKLLLDQQFERLVSLTDAEAQCQSLRKSQYVINPSSSVFDVLRAMAKSYYCCALIIEDDDSEDNEFIIRDVITMADVLNLIKMRKHEDSGITANDMIRYRERGPEPMTYRDPVISCCLGDSIHFLMSCIVREKASFVLIRSTNDPRSATRGILTAHDILNYIGTLPSNGFKNQIDSPLDKLADCKNFQTKYPANKMRSYSDVYSFAGLTSRTRDDSVDEFLDIEFS